MSAETLKSISTPDRVESRLGTLEFDDGAPSDATAALLYDNLDFMHGVQAFSVRCRARRLRRCAEDSVMGVQDNTFTFLPGADGFGVAVPDRELRHDLLLWLPRLDQRPDGDRSADVDPPSGILGTIDDMWFRWVTDIGLPGRTAARAAGT